MPSGIGQGKVLLGTTAEDGAAEFVFLAARNGATSPMNIDNVRGVAMTGIILSWLLSAFFGFAGVLNFIAPPQIRDQFRHWGFPSWFHFVVSATEIVAAIALAVPAWRSLGLAIAAATMAGATLVLVYHAERRHAVVPGAVLVTIALTAWLAR